MARYAWGTWLVILAACGDDDGSALDAAPADTVLVDVPIDMPTDVAIDMALGDPCAVCQPNEQCVQRFDGTCGMQVECVANGPNCQNNNCTQPCENAFCPQPYQCENRPPCGTESPNAFTCYGP
jgi:hypothetical protein